MSLSNRTFSFLFPVLENCIINPAFVSLFAVSFLNDQPINMNGSIPVHLLQDVQS